MELKTFFYRHNFGWSLPEFPAWDSTRTVVMVFGAPSFIDAPEKIQELKKAYPQARMVGCSSSGEIFGNSVRDNSLSVAVIRFEHTDVDVVTVPIQDSSASHAVGKAIADKINRPNLAGAFVLSDGLKVNGSALVQGLGTSLPKGAIVTGGLAGDGDRFQRTWILKDGKPESGYVSALAFYGKRIKLGHGSQGGWDIFGPERTVTKSEANVLYELDGKPALQLYKEYLGDKAAGLPASALLFPLQIRPSKKDDKKLVRTVLSVDEAKQVMVFAGDIPQGSQAQLMRANFDRLIDGASGAAHAIAQGIARPTLAIAISCVGRRLVLGERIEEEVEATLENLPPGTQQVGFYSYGEISPYVKDAPCELHNQTMTLTTIKEE